MIPRTNLLPARMARAVLLAVGLAAALPPAHGGDPDVMEAREADGVELRAQVFDTAWILPGGEADARSRRGPWLVGTLRDLVGRTFDPAGQGDGPSALPDRPALRNLGDLVARARARERGDGWLEALLAEARLEAPGLVDEAGPYLLALLDDAELRSPRWDPDREGARDGIFLAAPWDLAQGGARPWRDLAGSTLVQQAAALVFADLEAIKEAENDYRSYPARPGATYRWIGALPGSYLRGEDGELGPFAALRLRFRSSLPFPFRGYTCDLRILNRLDGNGHLVTDIYAVGRDFHWMAGRDVFLPLRTSQGEWVATLVVRLFGFDLAGVPDRDSHRRAALRASLGSLKREAEALFLRRGAEPRTVEGALPAFQVRGLRP